MLLLALDGDLGVTAPVLGGEGVRGVEVAGVGRGLMDGILSLLLIRKVYVSPKKLLQSSQILKY